jgi:membrane protein YqaA with SNARE-associated domain
MKILAPLLHFIFGLGYFAPLVMGILDSSFLVLPFGNDLLIVVLVAHHHADAPWLILMAACGSTIGVLLLALVSQKLGEAGVSRIAGEKFAITVGALAPPPFPFTVVIAAVAALDYPIWRILIFNFIARAARFAIIAVLAIEFGRAVLRIAKSWPFELAVIIFIALCAIASVFSIWRWLRRSRDKKK